MVFVLDVTFPAVPTPELLSTLLAGIDYMNKVTMFSLYMVQSVASAEEKLSAHITPLVFPRSRSRISEK